MSSESGLLVGAASLYGLTDADLDRRILACSIPIKGQRLCELIARGVPPVEAAIQIGAKPRGAARVVALVMSNPDAPMLIELHRERLRRFCGIDVEWLKNRFRKLAEKAETEKDFRAAILALKEIGELSALYPNKTMQLNVAARRVELSDSDVVKLSALIDVVEGSGYTRLEGAHDEHLPA